MATFTEMAEQWMRENLTVSTVQKAESESLPSSILPGHPAWLSPDGKWVTVFPRCPGCASYALHRQNNAYECQTCGLEAISEVKARRVGMEDRMQQEMHA